MATKIIFQRHKLQPANPHGSFRPIGWVAGILACLAFVAPAAADILLQDSFGGLFTSNRLNAAGNRVFITFEHGELGGIRVETPTNSSAPVWMAPSGRLVPTWAFSASSFDPFEPPSPLETNFNGSVSFQGEDNTGADALLPFSPPANAYRVSLDAIAGSAGIAIGFSSSQTVLTNNFASFGEVWLSLGGGRQGTTVPWTLRTHGTAGASVSGTTTLQAYNPLVLTYDPVAHTVHGTVNKVNTGSISYTNVAIIDAVGFEGSGTVDDFVVQTAAPVPPAGSHVVLMPDSQFVPGQPHR
jgi:hypothetical protein